VNDEDQKVFDDLVSQLTGPETKPGRSSWWLFGRYLHHFMAGAALAMLGSLLGWGWQHHVPLVIATATSGAVCLVISMWLDLRRD
jgi:hypothetical protein